MSVPTTSHATRTAVRLLAAVAAGAVAVVTYAGPAAAQTMVDTRTTVGIQTTVGTPSAMTIAERMARHRDVFMANPRDEGPTTVVLGGICTRLAEAGCTQMVSTKDASVMVFATAAKADLYTGHADDSATAFGRMVVSFGSPARVAAARHGAYEKAVKAFRRTHPAVKNDAVRAVRYVARRGLPMRDPQLEDSRGKRLGLASKIPGAVDMVATDQADVIVFDTRAAAEAYVGHADDKTYRVRRVVLSFGNPPRVVEDSQPRYERVFRAVLG